MDILCLQETNAADPDIQDRLDIQLQAKTSIWTQYCGVVSLDPAIQLDNAYVSTNGRLIICTVSHVNHLFHSFRLMNIYAPSTPYARYGFTLIFCNYLTFAPSSQISPPSPSDSLLTPLS